MTNLYCHLQHEDCEWLTPLFDIFRHFRVGNRCSRSKTIRTRQTRSSRGSWKCQKNPKLPSNNRERNFQLVVNHVIKYPRIDLSPKRTKSKANLQILPSGWPGSINHFLSRAIDVINCPFRALLHARSLSPAIFANRERTKRVTGLYLPLRHSTIGSALRRCGARCLREFIRAIMRLRRCGDVISNTRDLSVLPFSLSLSLSLSLCLVYTCISNEWDHDRVLCPPMC